MNLKDAQLFAEQIVKSSETVEFYGNKLSTPAERYKNLAECFLKLNSPVCCHSPVQCEACPMKRWEIGPNSWMSPLAKIQEPKVVKTPPYNPGRKGRPITLNGVPFESIASAARALGVHKAVINRMLRDANSEETRLSPA